MSHLGTQATELTEAKESAYYHVRFSSHSDSADNMITLKSRDVT